MSKTTQHTPGPWQTHVDSVRFPFVVQNAASQHIAETGHCVYIDPDVHAANARLIAAAPDLLAALQASEHTLAIAIEAARSNHLPNTAAALLDLLNTNRAAITQAQGTK